MITTLSAMQVSRIKRIIIGLLLALLGPALVGCSALRLSYSNGSQLAWWWLDGYFDFSRDHSPQVQQSLDRWFEWHRNTQLAPTTALLATVAQQMMEPTTPAQVCQWQDRVRAQLDPVLARSITDFAELVPGLGEPQMKHLQAHYSKLIDEMRRDFLQSDPAERLKVSIKRARERTERIYGSLDEAQARIIGEGVAASMFDPELWLQERQRRQRDTLQTLRRLINEKADHDQRVAALRALVQRSERSPNPEYRSYQTRLATYNCALAAQFHNATTPAQRAKARDNLRGWADDLRSLVPPT
jgi:hypothetical protein